MQEQIKITHLHQSLPRSGNTRTILLASRCSGVISHVTIDLCHTRWGLMWKESGDVRLCCDRGEAG